MKKIIYTILIVTLGMVCFVCGAMWQRSFHERAVYGAEGHNYGEFNLRKTRNPEALYLTTNRGGSIGGFTYINSDQGGDHYLTYLPFIDNELVTVTSSSEGNIWGLVGGVLLMDRNGDGIPEEIIDNSSIEKSRKVDLWYLDSEGNPIKRVIRK